MSCIEINPIEELLKAIGIVRGHRIENLYRCFVSKAMDDMKKEKLIAYNAAPDYLIRECDA